MAEPAGTLGTRGRPKNNFIWRHWSKITRLVGIITCVVLWGISFSLLHIADKRMPTYLIICSITITFFEVTFIINKVICCSLSIVCFLEPGTEMKNLVVAGICMNVMALFYMLKTIKDREPPEPYLYKQLEIG